MKGLVGLSKCEWITYSSLLCVEKVSPPGFEHTTYRSRSRHANHSATAPHKVVQPVIEWRHRKWWWGGWFLGDKLGDHWIIGHKSPKGANLTLLHAFAFEDAEVNAAGSNIVQWKFDRRSTGNQNGVVKAEELVPEIADLIYVKCQRNLHFFGVEQHSGTVSTVRHQGEWENKYGGLWPEINIKYRISQIVYLIVTKFQCIRGWATI